jgi:exodeoxyribonuclease VII large subunit
MVADVRAATPTAAAELAVPDRAEVARQLAVLVGRLSRRTQQGLATSRNALDSVLRSVVFRDPAFRLRSATQRLDDLMHRLRASLRDRLTRDRRRLDPMGQRLAALHPARLKERAAGKLEQLLARFRWALGGQSKKSNDRLLALSSRLAAAHPRNRLALASQKVEAMVRQLESMSYRSVLNRGFSVTRTAGGAILRSADEVTAGQVLETELASGRLRSIVEGEGQPPAEKAKPVPRKKADREDDAPSLF